MCSTFTKQDPDAFLPDHLLGNIDGSCYNSLHHIYIVTRQQHTLLSLLSVHRPPGYWIHTRISNSRSGCGNLGEMMCFWLSASWSYEYSWGIHNNNSRPNIPLFKWGNNPKYNSHLALWIAFDSKVSSWCHQVAVECVCVGGHDQISFFPVLALLITYEITVIGTQYWFSGSLSMENLPDAIVLHMWQVI